MNLVTFHRLTRLGLDTIDIPSSEGEIMLLTMSNGLRDNLEAGLLFFVIDVLVTVLLFPLVLRHAENKRWQPMRLEIVNGLLSCQLRTVQALKADFECIFALYLSQHIVAREKYEVVMAHDVRTALSAAHHDLRQCIDLFAPATEPAMARAIIDLMYLPTKVSEHLAKIDEYLSDLLYFDETRGPHIKITGKFRESVNGDIISIVAELREAGRELRTVISQSSIPRRKKAELEADLSAAIDRHLEIMNAAGGLMELLIHRIFSYFENLRYDTIDEWLGAHDLTNYQSLAVLEFGDREVIDAYYRSRAEAPPEAESAPRQ